MSDLPRGGASPAGAPLSPRTAALVRLLFLALACLALAPALASLSEFTVRYDWRYFEAMGEMSRRSVLWFHQAPLWNPYSCGGEVALANPQSLDLAPTFLLVLLFGVAAGYKLALVAYHFVALDGAFRLGRRFGLSLQGALYCSIAYGLSGWFALHFSQGHVTFIGVTLYPYLLVAYDRALDELEWAVPTGLAFAWILSLGGTFTPPMAAELLAVWAAIACLRRRSPRPIAALALAALVTLGTSAIRMLPVLQFIHDHPRPPFMRATDRLLPHELVLALVAWRPLQPVPGHPYWTHEYTARLPWILAPLWLLGLSLPLARRRLRLDLPAPTRRAAVDLAILALVAALLSLGNFAPFAPWSLLQRLPVLRDLRVPSRHLILVVLALAPLVGMAWDAVRAFAIERRGEAWRRRLRAIGALGIALAALDGAAFIAWQYSAYNPYGRAFGAKLALPAEPPRFFQEHGYWSSMRETLFRGHGSIDTPGSTRGPGCDEEAPLQRAEALDAGDVPQVRLLDPDAGEVTGSRFTPNVRTVEVELRAGARPTKLLVNSNWNEHFHVDVDGQSDVPRLTKVAGRLAVDLAGLPPGRHTVVLRYAPRTFTVGAIVTGVSLPLCLGLFAAVRRSRRARRRRQLPR